MPSPEPPGTSTCGSIDLPTTQRVSTARSRCSARDLADAETVFQIGVAPRRIDIMTSITGVEFAEAWERRSHGNYDDVRFPLIGLHALIKNKLAVGRPQDLIDVEMLRRHHPSAE